MSKILRLAVVGAGIGPILSKVPLPTTQDQDGTLMKLLQGEPHLVLLTTTQRRETEEQLHRVHERRPVYHIVVSDLLSVRPLFLSGLKESTEPLLGTFYTVSPGGQGSPQSATH